MERFRQAADILPDATVVLEETNNKLSWCNKASRQLLGLRTPQDYGQPITNLIRHPKMGNFLANADPEDSIELPSPANDQLILSVRIIPYSKKWRLLLAANVTRLHRLEQLRQDFIANVSHELRTPLTVISGYLEIMQDANDIAEHWRQPLKGMHQQAIRMLTIIEDLLMLSRLETEADRQGWAVAIPGMLSALAEDARALSSEHEVHLEATSNLWMTGSEKELYSAFSNLIINAVRHTPAQSRIVIRWFADDDGIHFQVEDSGEGIAPHHLARITERFYRVDDCRQRETGGSGLGLAIVKHVVAKHDGKLRIQSQIGVGSLFSCDFPMQRGVFKLPLTEVTG